ncbi:MAG: hypothetical protein Q8Q50_02820 [Methylobacter sp.]|nr:hypothetical protein [Methylobacter sp.]
MKTVMTPFPDVEAPCPECGLLVMIGGWEFEASSLYFAKVTTCCEDCDVEFLVQVE